MPYIKKKFKRKIILARVVETIHYDMSKVNNFPQRVLDVIALIAPRKVAGYS